MENYLDAMKIHPDTCIDIMVPSWHLNSHGKACHDNFSLGYLVGTGRTCSEDVETSWLHTNALAPSVCEMGPAACHETLNNHWGGWNFHKIVGFSLFTSILHAMSYSKIVQYTGTLLLKCFQTAFMMSKCHQDIADQLSKTFSAKTIKKWDVMVKWWNKDKTVQNPCAEPQCSELISLYNS